MSASAGSVADRCSSTGAAPSATGGFITSSMSATLPSTSIPLFCSPVRTAFTKYSVGLPTVMRRVCFALSTAMLPVKRAPGVLGSASMLMAFAVPAAPVVRLLTSGTRAWDGESASSGASPTPAPGVMNTWAVPSLNCRPLAAAE